MHRLAVTWNHDQKGAREAREKSDHSVMLQSLPPMLMREGHFTRHCTLDSRLTIPSPSHLLIVQHGISQHGGELKGGEGLARACMRQAPQRLPSSRLSSLGCCVSIPDTRSNQRSSRLESRWVESSRASRLPVVVDLLSLITAGGVFNVHVPGGWRRPHERTWCFNNRRSKGKSNQKHDVEAQRGKEPSCPARRSE